MDVTLGTREQELYTDVCGLYELIGLQEREKGGQPIGPSLPLFLGVSLKDQSQCSDVMLGTHETPGV